MTECEKKKIEKNGLIHITKKENVEKIILNGVIPGKEYLFFEEGLTWFYIFDEDNLKEKVKIVQNKKGIGSYDSYVLIKNICQEDINNMKIRRQIDDAVVFYGTLKTSDMKVFGLYKEEKD